MQRHQWCAAILAVLIATKASTPVAAQPIVNGSLITFNDNGAWSWFEGERVIVDRSANTLLLSTVANGSGAGGASRAGNVEITSYNYTNAALQRFTLNPAFQADDHNSAGLYIRPDGRYVASYSKHGNDNLTHWRVSTNAASIASWGGDQTIDNGAGTTYSNLYNLFTENGGTGRLYNFTRSVGFNPNFNVSNDQGSTWSYGGRLLQGPGRPYVNFASNATDKIWFIATDQHPRDFNNSIYAGYVSNGQLHKSDGTVVDSNLFDGTGVAPTALTKIFSGDANNIGWTTDIHLDAAGLPYVAFTVRKGTTQLPGGQGGMDHRFYYARFNGTSWSVNQMAFAGSELYASEGDYTGLVALDPKDPNTVYISTNVDPQTNAALVSSSDGIRHRELFHGHTTDGGITWTWTAVTANSTQDNIRPVMPDWDADHEAVVWLRGTYSSYTNYNLSVVGLVTVPEPSALLLLSGIGFWVALRRKFGRKTTNHDIAVRACY